MYTLHCCAVGKTQISKNLATHNVSLITDTELSRIHSIIIMSCVA